MKSNPEFDTLEECYEYELQRLLKAWRIIQKAYSKAFPLINEECLYEQYDLGLTDFVSMIAKCESWTAGELDSREETLVCALNQSAKAHK